MPLADEFLAQGFDAADAESRAALVERAVDRYRRETNRDPAWRWFVPGRIEIFGKHTDYAGGRSLLAAVPRGFAVVAGPRDDGIVRVMDARYGGEVIVDPHDRDRDFKGWTSYIAVVARRLARNFPGANLATDVAIASDLPRAAGVSSSSALVVGVASALIERAALAERPDWQAAIQSPQDLAGYLGAVENGLTFGALAGTSGVGTHGGSEDHTAILTCRAGRVSAYSFVPVVHQGDEDMPADWRFVVVSSGIEADKAGSARDRYNRASLATRALVATWNAVASRQERSLAGVLTSGAGAESHLRRLLVERAHADFSPDDLATRLTHFIAEDARIPRAARAFRQAEAAALGALAQTSQEEADRWLGNQIPETRALAEVARAEGAFAATSFGAGFGGSVWALVDAADATSFIARAVRAYQQRFPNAGAVESFAARPSSGLVRI